MTGIEVTLSDGTTDLWDAADYPAVSFEIDETRVLGISYRPPASEADLQALRPTERARYLANPPETPERLLVVYRDWARVRMHYA